MKQLIAIEGIVHAGKTTLIKNLEKIYNTSNFQFIKEYGNFVGGGQHFPGFPQDQTEALTSNIFLRNWKKDDLKPSNNQVRW